MAHNNDPPWLRQSPKFVLSQSTDEQPSISPPPDPAPAPDPPANSSLFPSNYTMLSTRTLLPSTSSTTTPAPPSTVDDDQYIGWRPQLISPQTAAQAPPLSPLDLAMYPGAPVENDPAAARRAVAGLRPLRILSSRRPGGPASAGPSRSSSVQGGDSGSNSPSTASRSGIMGFISAARRASTIVISGPSSTPSPRASTQNLPISRAPIPVSPLPPPRTPPLVPTLALGPGYSDQMEPELKAYLESLAAQAASKSSSSSRHTSNSQVLQTGPIGLGEEDEDIMLEIRDLDAGQVISIRNLDAVAPSQVVNRKSQSTSHRPPSISEFMVVRNLDAQPRTPPPPLPPPPLQRSRAPPTRPLTPPRSLSPIKLLSPVHIVSSSRRSRQPPVTPLTEAVYVNQDLERSLSSLENALILARQSHSGSTSASSPRHDTFSRAHTVQTPRTAHTTSSHLSSVFSSRTLGSPLTTPPASPPPLPRSKHTLPPCMKLCGRPECLPSLSSFGRGQ
ncbi:hypothetical protein BDV93DRAFT_551721 [Ceratobasidium sp. AG-I]|nr:hypothetical protein BDV93DRAFT_551721 [Ceratobasidium sp. AG-I]